MASVRGRGSRLAVGGLLSLSMIMGTAACGGGDSGPRGDVSMDDTLRFSPNKIGINLDEEATFTFVNRDNVVHNITVPALSNDAEQNAIEIDVAPGQRGTLKLPKVSSAPRDGFFLFYCKYHQTQGMSGRITVSG
ncbi:MAG: plastocyanin/azurin family copper-binding protein [Acidimicrobiales bacterium]